MRRADIITAGRRSNPARQNIEEAIKRIMVPDVASQKEQKL